MQSFWWFRLWPRTSFIMSTAAFFKICNLNQIFKTYLNLKCIIYSIYTLAMPLLISCCVQALGDEYVPPVGLPEWKQPSFDDDDHVDLDKFQNAAPQVDFFYFFKLFCKRFLLAFLSPRASGRSWSSCRMSWEWPRHSTSASSEPLAPSSPSWLSSSRSSVALAKV